MGHAEQSLNITIATCTHIPRHLALHLSKQEIAGGHKHVLSAYRNFTVRVRRLLRTVWGTKIVIDEFFPKIPRYRGDTGLTLNFPKFSVLTNIAPMRLQKLQEFMRKDLARRDPKFYTIIKGQHLYIENYFLGK